MKIYATGRKCVCYKINYYIRMALILIYPISYVRDLWKVYKVMGSILSTI